MDLPLRIPESASYRPWDTDEHHGLHGFNPNLCSDFTQLVIRPTELGWNTLKPMNFHNEIFKILFITVFLAMPSEIVQSKESLQVIDPSVVPALDIGDEGDQNHPQGSGIYKIEIEGPTRRTYKFEGAPKVTIPLTDLKAGQYLVRAFDGLGKVTTRRFRIKKYVPAKPSSLKIKKSNSAENLERTK